MRTDSHQYPDRAGADTTGSPTRDAHTDRSVKTAGRRGPTRRGGESVMMRHSTRTRTADVYPTRSSAVSELSGRVQWIDRPHPVVWSDPHLSEGPLDADTLLRHDDKGYTIVPGLLSPAEVQDYWVELERLTDDPSLADDERVIREKESGAIRSIFEAHRI